MPTEKDRKRVVRQAEQAGRKNLDALYKKIGDRPPTLEEFVGAFRKSLMEGFDQMGAGKSHPFIDKATALFSKTMADGWKDKKGE
jgi:hypothetical protein